MATSEAQKRANKKWQTEKTDEVRFRVQKGEKQLIQAHAEQQGETLNAFLRRAVSETMYNDRSKKEDNQ